MARREESNDRNNILPYFYIKYSIMPPSKIKKIATSFQNMLPIPADPY